MFPGVSRRGTHPDVLRLPTDAGGAPRIADRAGGRQRREGRKAIQCRRSHCIYGGLGLAVAAVFVLGIWQQRSMSIAGGDLSGHDEVSRGARRPSGSVLRFVPPSVLGRFEQWEGLERERSERGSLGIRPPRLALIIGTMGIDPQSLMLLTLAKSLTELGYQFTVYTVEDGGASYLWVDAGHELYFISSENSCSIDWSNYEGVILSSLEGKGVISSLMQEPFTSVPLVWLIHEDILGKRLNHYTDQGLQDLITQWRSAFSRADVIVFPDFSLPLLYSSIDTGNFMVIPGSPADFWASKSYISSHQQDHLRKNYRFSEEDLIILVIGSYFFYDELPWDFAAALHALVPQILKFARGKDLRVQFVFLCGNSTDAYGSAFQELATHMGFPNGLVRHYSMEHDVNSLLLMANIVLYGSFQEEPTFPPLLLRAMSFEIPIIAPNLTVITRHVRDRVHGFLFYPSDSNTLARALSLVIEEKKLSDLARVVASQAKILSENMLAYDCITSHAKLLENVIQFPSDVKLPASVSQIKQNSWLWDLFDKKTREEYGDKQTEEYHNNHSRIVDLLEAQFAEITHKEKSDVGNDTSVYDYPTQLDWDDLSEMEISEDIERREMQELEERMEKTSGSWEDVYRNARKAEKLKFEGNERDEGELERTGQQVCIYEIYSGEGAWPFLHHGSMYRGITLSKGARRSRTDDIDAVSRLHILNETYYKDLFCEFGSMFAVANRVDSIHKLPWIGFQSWHAAGRKVSLSKRAEEALEESILAENKGDVVYYWVPMVMDQKDVGGNINLDFWSMCDHQNAGRCSALFEDAFRLMYELPDHMAVLPPMPGNGDYWSILHSWVMPTPSFLEFVMFSRMFVDSLDSLSHNYSSPAACLLGSSKLEKKHCYCRILEVLVNVWAYHSARKMVYLDPISGELREQHPVVQREMWVKYFNFTLLKSMDEDLAEDADDGMHSGGPWLWPSTGEVHWQGIFEREREERYRQKMDKKRKTKEKLLERHKFGYKQKALGQKEKSR
ncbi:uncharacterized protein [Typha angustifolia]|uniref:uncharacterized protein n=1 Tax=Typha angustifolia TaxID=59011 RepID=UPI003C2C95F2